MEMDKKKVFNLFYMPCAGCHVEWQRNS